MGEDTLPTVWVWEDILERFDKTEVARVSWIEHAPLSNVWDRLDMKDTVAEVGNHEYSKDESRGSIKSNSTNVWFVKIIKSAGYFVRVRFLGYPESQEDEVAANDVWVHYNVLKQVGNHTKAQMGIMPPIDMDSTKEECKNRLFAEMVGKLSVDPLFTDEKIINRGLTNRWTVGQKVEVRDKDCVSQMRVGFIKRRRGGRVWVSYWDSKGKGADSCWVHEESEFIKPEGWSHATGGKLNAPDHYKPLLVDESHLQADLSISIEEEMCFEMINPVRLNEIAAAEVTKVLGNGYFMCRLACNLAEVDVQEFLQGENEFHLHISSAHIFRCGTCAEYDQPLSVPASEDNDGNERFSWEIYFSKTGRKPLPLPTKHADSALLKLKKGMWIEAVDSHLTEMVCPANVHDIMGPYAVKVRFPGWSDAYDQWKPLDSTELFPIGWSQLVSQPLAPPGNEMKTYDHIFTHEEDPKSKEDYQEPNQSERNKPKRRGRPPVKRAPARDKSILNTPSSAPKKSPKKREVRKRKSSFSQLDSEEDSISLDGDEIVASTRKTVTARKTAVKKEGGRGKRARVENNVSDCESVSVSGDDSGIDPHSIRRSSRSRQAPTFFGDNVDTRHINLIL